MVLEQLDLDSRRRDLGEVRLQEPAHVLGLLVWHQAEAHLGHRFGREHGLGPLTGIPRQESVHLTGGADPQALQNGPPSFPCERGRSYSQAEVVLVERETRDLRPCLGVPLQHIVVKALDGDAAIGVVEARDDARESGARIGDGTPVGARVHVGLGGARPELEVGEPAQREEQ